VEEREEIKERINPVGEKEPQSGAQGNPQGNYRNNKLINYLINCARVLFLWLQLFSKNVLTLSNDYGPKGLGYIMLLLLMWDFVFRYFSISISLGKVSYCVVAWLVLVLISAGWDINVSRRLIIVPALLIGAFSFYVFLNAYMSINNKPLIQTLEIFHFFKLSRIHFTSVELNNYIDSTMVSMGIGQVSGEEALVLKRCKTPEEIDAVLSTIYASHNTLFYRVSNFAVKAVSGETGKAIYVSLRITANAIQIFLFFIRFFL
jgi:hypothetical protein